MQVYEVIGDGMTTPEFFRNFQDIEPSLRISYSSCTEVQIMKSPTTGPIKFTVTGYRDGDRFEETLLVNRYSVWDSPTHL